MAHVALVPQNSHPSAREKSRIRQMNQIEWYFIYASTCRKFRPGEIVGTGELLGLTVSGNPVYAGVGGKVRSIQYDFWREEVILEVAS